MQRGRSFWEQLVSKYDSKGSMTKLTPDNNAAERAIRAFVMGRKTGWHRGLHMGQIHPVLCIHSLKPPDRSGEGATDIAKRGRYTG